MLFAWEPLEAPRIFVGTPSITCEISILSFHKPNSYEAYGLTIRIGPTDCQSIRVQI